MAENNTTPPATLLSLDECASEDSWTFLDEFDHSHASDSNNEGVRQPSENDEMENPTEAPIESATEAVALDGIQTLEHFDVIKNGIEPQWYVDERIGSIES